MININVEWENGTRVAWANREEMCINFAAGP